MWSFDQNPGKLLPEDFLGNRHVLSISSNVQNRCSDEVYALDYVLYLIDIQNKKEACLNFVFSYALNGLQEHSNSLLQEFPNADATQPDAAFHHLNIKKDGQTIRPLFAGFASLYGYCKNRVRAGPFTAWFFSDASNPMLFYLLVIIQVNIVYVIEK